MRKQLTPEDAEALTDVSAKVMQTLFDATHAHPALSWTDLVMATTVAMRGLAARECKNNPVLPMQVAKALMMMNIAQAMALPDEIVVAVGDDDPGRPDIVGVIPLHGKKH
jgi:hypothetical protein